MASLSPSSDHLVSLGPDALSHVFELLNAYDLAYLWFSGSASLRNTLATRVRTFELTLQPQLKPKWPRLVSNFPQLSTFIMKPLDGLEYPLIEDQEITLIPSGVQNMTLKIDQADYAFSLRSSHFRDLKTLSLRTNWLHSSTERATFVKGLTTLDLGVEQPRSKWMLHVSHMPPTLTSLTGCFLSAHLKESDNFPESLTHLHLKVYVLPPTFISRLPPQMHTLDLEWIGAEASMEDCLEPFPRDLYSLTLRGIIFEPEDAPKLREISQSCLNLREFNLFPGSTFTIPELLPFLPKTVTSVGGNWCDTVDEESAALVPRTIVSLGDVASFQLPTLYEPFLPSLQVWSQQSELDGTYLNKPSEVFRYRQGLRTFRLENMSAHFFEHLPASLTSLTMEFLLMDVKQVPKESLGHLKHLTRMTVHNGSLVGLSGELSLPPNLVELHATSIDIWSPSLILPPSPTIPTLPHTLRVLHLQFWEFDVSLLPPLLSELDVCLRSLDHAGASRLPKQLRVLNLKLLEEHGDGQWGRFLRALPRGLTSFTLGLRSTESWSTETHWQDMACLPRGLKNLILPRTSAFADPDHLDALPETLRTFWFAGSWKHKTWQAFATRADDQRKSRMRALRRSLATVAMWPAGWLRPAAQRVETYETGESDESGQEDSDEEYEEYEEDEEHDNETEEEEFGY